MVKLFKNLKEKFILYLREKKVNRVINKRQINNGHIKILKMEHVNEYDFVWIELLDYYDDYKNSIFIPVFNELNKAEYPFEIILLKDGKIVEEELGRRIALRFKNYNNDYLSLEQNKENLLFLSVLCDKYIDTEANLNEFVSGFNVFLIKDLTKRYARKNRNFKAYFVKLDGKHTNYETNRIFLYDTDKNKFVKQFYISKPKKDLKVDVLKPLFSEVIDDYLEKTYRGYCIKNDKTLEEWNGEL